MTAAENVATAFHCRYDCCHGMMAGGRGCSQPGADSRPCWADWLPPPLPPPPLLPLALGPLLLLLLSAAAGVHSGCEAA